MYAKALSLLGMGFGITEAQHAILLAAAILVSVAVSAWRTYRTGRAWPLLVALIGSSMVLAGHWLHELHALEWAGVAVMLVGGLTEQLYLRSKAALGRPAVA